MNQVVVTGYLLRPLIEDTAFTIENDYLRITSPSTIFVDARRVIPVDKNEILALYKRVLRKAKAQGTRISYIRHFRRQIMECWDEYENHCSEALVLFERMIQQVKVVEERGLHYGTRDDMELDKLGALQSSYLRFFWSDSVISRISSINHDLLRLENSFASPHFQMDMISL